MNKIWENLTEEEKLFWDKFAETHKDVLLLVRFVKDKGCWLCSFKPKNWSKFEFHLKSTHGIDRELLPLYAKKIYSAKINSQ